MNRFSVIVIAFLFVTLTSIDLISAARRRRLRPQSRRQTNRDMTAAESVHSSTVDGTPSYMLPASPDSVLTEKRINNQMVCETPGIFADVNNNCQIFHFCVLTGRPGNTGFDLRQYSFFCGNTTIFDQYTLTCQVPEKAVPCEYAAQFFTINQRTDEGKKEVWIHREEDDPIVRPYYEEAHVRTKGRSNFIR